MKVNHKVMQLLLYPRLKGSSSILLDFFPILLWIENSVAFFSYACSAKFLEEKPHQNKKVFNKHLEWYLHYVFSCNDCYSSEHS